MKIIEINLSNKHLLENFLKKDIPIAFRYFKKRNIDIINNHILTILLIDNNNEIGYAHIDYDNNQYWFGICLITEYQSKGYGKKMMEYIFTNEKLKNINEIVLSVDKININAINLYTKFNFKIINETELYYLMKKQQT